MSHYDEKSQAEKAKAKQGQQNPQAKPTGMRGEQDIRNKGREQANPGQARATERDRERSGYERGNVEH